MLVFTRKVEEGFWIGDRIFVKVLVIGRRRVSLGIEAPAEWKIARAERSSRLPGGSDEPFEPALANERRPSALKMRGAEPETLPHSPKR